MTERVDEKTLFKNLVYKIPQYIFWKDKSSVFMGCNDKFAHLLGLDSPEDIIGLSDDDLNWQSDGHTAHYFQEKDKEVLEGKEIINLEQTLSRPDGRKIVILTNKSPIYDSNGYVVGVLGIAFDITEKKKMESQLKKAMLKAHAASEAKSEFIANMSHDIRTPITGIVGMIQDLLNTAENIHTQLRGTTPLTHSAEDLFYLLKSVRDTLQRDGSFLMGATDELLQLCNEILEVIRLEKGVMSEKEESFDLRELIQHNIELLQPLALHKKLNLSADIDPAVPKYFSGLRIYMDRILLNLIGNALKFTEQGFVKAIVRLGDEGTMNAQKGDTVSVKVIVEDSGIGIPEDKFETIFEHFSRLTPAYRGVHKGSGLGLYTVKRYVEAMRGGIDVESEIDKGSRFSVTIPLMVSDHVDRPRESVRQSVPLPENILSTFDESGTIKQSLSAVTTAAILVVEDNVAAAIGVTLALKAFNCPTDIAENGTEALEKATRNQYDLILMDIGLPDISGVEVARRIRALKDNDKAKVPIVALTGHAGNDEKHRECIEAGMEAVLSKPAQPLMLESILRRFVLHTNFDTEKLSEDTQSSKEVKSSDVIDWEGCVHMCMGDPEFACQLLSMLVEDLKTTQPVLEKAYTDQDTHTLHTELHRLRGGVCYLKLPQLDHALEAFHKAVKAEPQHLAVLNATYDALQQAIEAFWKVYKERGFPPLEE